MKTIEKDGFVIEIKNDGCRKIIGLTQPVETAVLTVPDDVAEIADRVFANDRRIEKVILPKTLRKIGNRAFEGMSNLREIDLENVKEIGDRAFYKCDSLKKISLKCDKIGNEVFYGCSDLTEAEVDCKIIGKSMFESCVRLQKAELKNTRILGEKAFCKTTALKEIVFPPELEEIKEGAFNGAGMETLTIPKTVRRLGKAVVNYRVREIHLYDNIETDIGPQNYLSKSSCILYVHSAETDEIKYAVPIFDKAVYSMFKGGVSFDFKTIDSGYSTMVNFYSNWKNDLFTTGVLRLKYGYELDEETRRKHEDRLFSLSAAIAKEFIRKSKNVSDSDPLLFQTEFYQYMSVDDLLVLIDLSAQHHLTELTAFLMQICNEKRKED